MLTKKMQKWIVVVVVLVMLLSIGIPVASQLFHSDDAPSATAPMVSPSPTVKPEATAVMSQQNEDGAKATFAYVLGSFAYMFATGDTSVFRDYSAADCTACTDFVSQAGQLKAAGGYQVGGLILVSESAANVTDGPAEAPTKIHVELRIAQDQAILYTSKSAAPQTAASGEGLVSGELEWLDGKWKLHSFTSTPDAADSAAPGESPAATPAATPSS